ncbi:MAG: helicase-exonuclease AddAB subunit AddA [Oscillospiraceae bacterium]|nr:helicase-exonuclease AddAB subunit AddA [Oscillospiraceae bacterium]
MDTTNTTELIYTPQQEAAIFHRNGSLLVSAGAGSGKTRVLVERLLNRVEQGDDLDEFLVITFTKAAAAELRERIHDEILKKIAVEPDNRRLRKQRMLVGNAAIGTIHSFCADILREHAHLVSISPDFRVADEEESMLLKSDILDELLNKAYETIDKNDGFRALIDATLAGRDDRRLVSMILDVHTKMRSNPEPEKWAMEQAAKYHVKNTGELSDTIWGSYLMEKVYADSKYWYETLKEMREEIRVYDDFDAAYGPSIDVSLADCERFLASFDIGWDECHKNNKIEFPRAKQARGYDNYKNIRNKCKDELAKCTAIFNINSMEHYDDIHHVFPALTALMEFILDFDIAYMEEKRNRGLVDFSDLEHLSLSLLREKDSGEKTDTAHFLAKRFKEIMVDEYQDINAVQEMIFNAVSENGNNIFMVGDVKQSIYRFRLADPTIFLEKYKNANTALVLLSKNFRSRGEILNFVNSIFEKIMTEDLGEMDYTEKEKLICGRDDEKQLETAVDLNVIDMSTYDDEDDEDSPDKISVEAQFIAKRIIELVNGPWQIPDGKGGMRNIEHSDIVILLRSVSGKAWHYAKALGEYDIPYDTPDGEGFFDTVEVSAVLSLLSVIDNPMQDIPLAAVLRGPIYGFSANDLARIRTENEGEDFYSALVNAAKTDEMFSHFLDDIDNMRQLAPDMSIVSFLWHIYNTTGILGRVSAMSGGKKRRMNLILLAEHALRFEENGYKGLYRFLAFIKDLKEKGVELTSAKEAISQNAVRIMSIHKSKGLEFPIVFLADTSKLFNFQDLQKPLVMHPQLGVGIKRIDTKRMVEYPTIARTAISRLIKSEMLSEELRILYVAMTRAKEKLIITAAFKDAMREIEKYLELVKPEAFDINRPIAAPVLEGVRHMAGWILAAVLSKYGQNDIFPDENGLIYFDSDFKFQLISVAGNINDDEDMAQHQEGTRGQSDIEEREAYVDSISENDVDNLNERADIWANAYNKALSRLREQFSYEYPHEAALNLPSKLTVTELKRRELEDENDDEGDYANYVKAQRSDAHRFTLDEPGFVSSIVGLSAAQRGTALHLAMQHIDFAYCQKEEDVRMELERLLDKGFITLMEKEAIDVEKIIRFFQSEIGKRMIVGENLKREFRFSLLRPAKSIYPEAGEDMILIQGIIDCFFEEQGELVLVDFKTDNVDAQTLEMKTESYIPQLREYSEALERISGKKVKERIIYFLSIDTAVNV